MERFVIKRHIFLLPVTRKLVSLFFLQKHARVVLRNKLEMFHRVRDSSPT
jgi:hypothetical protein